MVEHGKVRMDLMSSREVAAYLNDERSQALEAGRYLVGMMRDGR